MGEDAMTILSVILLCILFVTIFINYRASERIGFMKGVRFASRTLVKTGQYEAALFVINNPEFDAEVKKKLWAKLPELLPVEKDFEIGDKVRREIENETIRN